MGWQTVLDEEVEGRAVRVEVYSRDGKNPDDETGSVRITTTAPQTEINPMASPGDLREGDPGRVPLVAGLPINPLASTEIVEINDSEGVDDMGEQLTALGFSETAVDRIMAAIPESRAR